MLTSGQIWQDKSSRKNAQGNELYRKRDYDAALERYIQAQDGKNHQQELSYNVANTLYQQTKYPEATRELDKSLSASNPGLNQKIYFNRGNSFYQMRQYPQAVESYKKALELDPKDRDAKFNLELALKKLQENPEKKKENSPNKDQDQKKQDSSSKENQQSQNQQPDQQKPPKPGEQENKGDSQKENAKPNERDSSQNQLQKGEQKQGMDPKEALRILDAINNQEKKEQRKQVLKIQRAQVSGKDW